jgi:transcriptional accessory protein Tex/SPT6
LTVTVAEVFLDGYGFGLRALIHARDFEKLALLQTAANAVSSTIEEKRTLQTYASELIRLMKYSNREDVELDVRKQYEAIAAIYGELQKKRKTVSNVDLMVEINDIINELRKPGLDPRESAQEFEFSHDIHSIEDLRTGMELPGIVTNITAFGAFVDVGIKQNGLIHASQMGVKGMADPSKVLKLHQQVKVAVISVDLERGRVGLRLMK